MGDSTANPMDRWVCCGSPMNGNHAHGCVYSRPSWPVRTDYGTPSPAGGGETESGWPGAEAGRALGRHIAEEQALGEFGIKASKMAPSQMEAVERMAAELTRLRTALAAAERAGAERALRWAAANRRARQEDNETFRTRGISALFPVRPIPPPGAEVGRG